MDRDLQAGSILKVKCMNLADLERLMALEEAASPGPWKVIQLDDEMHMGSLVITRNAEANYNNLSMRAGTWPTGEIVAAFLLQSPPYAIIEDDKFEENARLVAYLRNCLKELLYFAKLGINYQHNSK